MNRQLYDNLIAKFSDDSRCDLITLSAANGDANVSSHV